MSSSREVTAQKKKDVWEDVGSEFYQESYPSGSKPPSTTHHRRPSRLAIPLPSHTARRGSLLQGGRHNKSGARRKNTHLTVNNTHGRGFTYNTSTMAVGDAHGTTTNANDIQVAILPDLSEETILNEKKTWEELLRIKTMPVPMGQKKQLKAQLATIPKLRLKGWKNIKWILQKAWQNVSFAVARKYRSTIFLNNDLRTIELRSGTAIVNVFLFIKWTIFLNIAMSLALITFIIGPYLTYYFVSGAGQIEPKANATTCNETHEGENIFLNVTSVQEDFLDCCVAQYKHVLNEDGANRGVVTFIMRKVGLGSFEGWPISYSFYNDPIITYDAAGSEYRFDVAYVLTGCAIFAGCLILLVQSIAAGVKEIIHLREGEFYKYSNLVFSGWEHYTNDEKGAEFKRRVLRNEMKIALQTEKKKVTDLLITKRQRAKIFIMRFLVNVTVLGLIATAGSVIFYATLELTNEGRGKVEHVDLIKGFVPSFAISFFNLIFPIILARLGKVEQYSREWETALILLRCLFIRIFSIYAAAFVFYRYTYCKPKPGYCFLCLEPISRQGELDLERSQCWESLFADQIYRLILTDLLIKIVLTFIVDPFRRLLGHCCKNKFGKRISTLSFNIVRHSLDVINIQILSWMSFHFAPFAPIFAVGYCILVFYIKKFSVLYNCKSVPDTFRTTKSTGMFMAAKIISFVVVLFTYAFIVVLMVPSAECGPFRGKLSAWESVRTQLHDNYPNLHDVLKKIGSPGIALPLALVLILLTYYYYSVAQANRAMVETLRHLLILEGHDKQYLFAKLNSLRRSKKQKHKVFESTRLNKRQSVTKVPALTHMTRRKSLKSM